MKFMTRTMEEHHIYVIYNSPKLLSDMFDYIGRDESLNRDDEETYTDRVVVDKIRSLVGTRFAQLPHELGDVAQVGEWMNDLGYLYRATIFIDQSALNLFKMTHPDTFKEEFRWLDNPDILFARYGYGNMV